MADPADARDGADAPPRLALEASPNPFTRATTARFTMAAAGNAQLRIYSPTGRLVRTLKAATTGEGVHGLTWDGLTRWGQPANAGVYFMRLDAGGQSVIRTVVRVE